MPGSQCAWKGLFVRHFGQCKCRLLRGDKWRVAFL